MLCDWLHSLLHKVKQVLRNNGRYTAGGYDVSEAILTDIPSVPENTASALSGLHFAILRASVMYRYICTAL